ncbi:MAG: glycosyltransferase [Bacteroidota bacterium]
MSKRLLFITPIFPKDATEDTVVPFIFQFTQQFSYDTDVKIDVISLMYPFSQTPYKIGNIAVFPIGSQFKNSVKQLPYLIKAIYKAIQLSRKNNYDGVLCFWYRESALVGKIVSLLMRKKLVVWMHGQDINKDNKFIRMLNIPKEKLVMLSQQQLDYFYENHQIKVDKIANVSISRKKFPQLNKSERKIDVIGVGNLGALKNYSLFIELLSEVKNKNLNAVVIGVGEEMAMLKEKAAKLGMKDTINFVGALPHKEVLDYMNNAKVFLHTSKSEGGGGVIQEALYSGCKVVSTIAIENGDLLDCFYFGTEPKQLSAKIDSFLSDGKLPERIEHFKMEDTISVIYNSFYKD